MKITPFAVALLLGLGLTSANAAPLPKVEQLVGTTNIVDVQYKKHHYKKGPPKKHRWVAGRRYDRSPPGWRRHAKRPPDWSRRGCVIVGPVWFCP